MNVGLVIAGSLCFVLAAGHEFVGRRLLDLLGDGAFPRGPFVFTWHVLTLMMITTGAVLISLARREPADYRRVVVFLVGAAYAAATVLQIWRSRQRPSELLRAPLWVPFIVIMVLCWLTA